MNASHPELETLAELVERADDGLDRSGAEALAHIGTCAQCQKDLEALREVRGVLRALPPVSMPDDVAARLEAALRAEAAKPVDKPAGSPAIAVLPTQRAGAGAGRFHLSAAASVVVLLLVALGAGITAIAMSAHGHSSKNGTAASGAMAPQAAKVVLASGIDYRQDTIRSQVAALVVARVAGSTKEFKGLTSLAGAAAGSAAAAASAVPRATASSSAAQSSASAPAATPAVSARTAPGGPLADPQALQACVETLTGGKAEQPVLVDYALYNGRPATIIVLRDDSKPDTLDVWVEADSGDCVKNGDTAYYGRLSGSS